MPAKTSLQLSERPAVCANLKKKRKEKTGDHLRPTFKINNKSVQPPSSPLVYKRAAWNWLENIISHGSLFCEWACWVSCDLQGMQFQLIAMHPKFPLLFIKSPVSILHSRSQVCNPPPLGWLQLNPSLGKLAKPSAANHIFLKLQNISSRFDSVLFFVFFKKERHVPTCHETQGEVQRPLRWHSGGVWLPRGPHSVAAHVLFPVRTIYKKKKKRRAKTGVEGGRHNTVANMAITEFLQGSRPQSMKNMKERKG